MKALVFHQLTVAIALVLFMTACQGGGGSSAAQQPVAPVKPTPTPSPVSQDNSSSRTVQKPTPAGTVELSIFKNTDMPETRRNTESFLSQLNKYTVSIKIPESISNAVVYRQIDDADSVKVDISTDENGIAKDRIQYSGKYLAPQNYHYFIVANDQVLADATFQILADVRVSGERKASELNLNPGRHSIGILYMDYRSRLNTQGQSYNLSAKEVVANNSVIESFSEDESNTAAADGLQGHEGGKIAIETESAAGTLTVFMRGTKGGKGRDADAITDKAKKGPQGTDEVAHRTRICEPSVKRTIDPNVAYGPPQCQVVTDCQVRATAGGPGANGIKGSDGDAGLPGGNSGSFSMIAKNSQNFFVTTTSIAGVGGVGGNGGKGQVGGEGGDPGKSILCSRVSSGLGPKGKDGEDGKQGSVGASGLNQQNCVRTSEQALEVCQ